MSDGLTRWRISDLRKQESENPEPKLRLRNGDTTIRNGPGIDTIILDDGRSDDLDLLNRSVGKEGGGRHECQLLIR